MSIIIAFLYKLITILYENKKSPKYREIISAVKVDNYWLMLLFRILEKRSIHPQPERNRLRVITRGILEILT